jgi:hypothetical protein
MKLFNANENMMKLKKTSANATFSKASNQQTIRTWNQLLNGTLFSFHSLAMVERPRLDRGEID